MELLLAESPKVSCVLELPCWRLCQPAVTMAVGLHMGCASLKHVCTKQRGFGSPSCFCKGDLAHSSSEKVGRTVARPWPVYPTSLQNREDKFCLQQLLRVEAPPVVEKVVQLLVWEDQVRSGLGLQTCHLH